MCYPYALAELANNLTSLRGDRIVCRVFFERFCQSDLTIIKRVCGMPCLLANLSARHFRLRVILSSYSMSKVCAASHSSLMRTYMSYPFFSVSYT